MNTNLLNKGRFMHYKMHFFIADQRFVHLLHIAQSNWRHHPRWAEVRRCCHGAPHTQPPTPRMRKHQQYLLSQRSGTQLLGSYHDKIHLAMEYTTIFRSHIVYSMGAYKALSIVAIGFLCITQISINLTAQPFSNTPIGII